LTANPATLNIEGNDGRPAVSGRKGKTMNGNHFKALMGAAAVALALAATPALASFDGFGKDIPLESAAKQIVPDGWSVDYGPGVDSKAAVSWNSASDWQSALRTAVARKGYEAQIGSSSVMIVKSDRAAEAPRPYAASGKAAPKAKPAVRRAPKPAHTEVREGSFQGGGGFSIRPYHGTDGRLATKEDGGRSEAYSGGFSVSEGQMLHPVLADWAAAAGWELVWDSEFDYRLEAAARFSGDFVDAVSALTRAMEDARPSITVEFYKGNHVVVVSNKSSDEAN